MPEHDTRSVLADDAKLARVALGGLPVLTIAIALGLGLMRGPALSILALAGGVLLGVIVLFWSSLRVLSGEVPLSPELDALENRSTGSLDLLARKKMLLRALKDLENERAVGKMGQEDFDELSAGLRAELKGVLRRIDASLAPHRAEAERALREHFTSLGLEEAPLAASNEESHEVRDGS
jgi:hypothetical protein